VQASTCRLDRFAPPPATAADDPSNLLFYMKLNRQIAADVIQPSNQTVKH
jgi:hypothetical protein